MRIFRARSVTHRPGRLGERAETAFPAVNTFVGMGDPVGFRKRPQDAFLGRESVVVPPALEFEKHIVAEPRVDHRVIGFDVEPRLLDRLLQTHPEIDVVDDHLDHRGPDAPPP